MEVDPTAGLDHLYMGLLKHLDRRRRCAFACFCAERTIRILGITDELPEACRDQLGRAWQYAEGEIPTSGEKAAWEKRMESIFPQLLHRGPQNARNAAFTILRAFHAITEEEDAAESGSRTIEAVRKHRELKVFWGRKPDPAALHPELRAEYELHLEVIRTLFAAATEDVGRQLLMPFIEPANNTQGLPQGESIAILRGRLIELCSEREHNALFDGKSYDALNDPGYLKAQGYKSARRAIAGIELCDEPEIYLSGLIKALKEVRARVMDSLEDPRGMGIGAIDDIVASLEAESRVREWKSVVGGPIELRRRLIQGCEEIYGQVKYDRGYGDDSARMIARGILTSKRIIEDRPLDKGVLEYLVDVQQAILDESRRVEAGADDPDGWVLSGLRGVLRIIAKEKQDVQSKLSDPTS